ncbi:hypothetical protein [Rhizobium halophytocola]|uniref:Curlin n=1 Tax=Rhizobium halophytocola TaxID=735519 RepID=A0ABS4DUS3_9HYPH|nr:hypothetical protein [Rhizobium halophytocola]MBP1849447.1 hypothetical protein [Rhizobium halophytocola]
MTAFKTYRTLHGLAVGIALAAATTAATTAKAEDLLVQDYQTDAAAVGALMQPIQPFLGGAQGSTTSIIQLGSANNAAVNIAGNGSLALIQQAGDNNRAIQSIEGSSSALLLAQGGRNNSVVQAAKGNNDFQLVGVSGSDNQVAYVQVGDNLAGALDVRDSTNSTVLAFQTPQSGSYMMPTGLRGLDNKVVVVVPGRMYVLPKR